MFSEPHVLSSASRLLSSQQSHPPPPHPSSCSHGNGAVKERAENYETWEKTDTRPHCGGDRQCVWSGLTPQTDESHPNIQQLGRTGGRTSVGHQWEHHKKPRFPSDCFKVHPHVCLFKYRLSSTSFLCESDHRADLQVPAAARSASTRRTLDVCTAETNP